MRCCCVPCSWQQQWGEGGAARQPLHPLFPRVRIVVSEGLQDMLPFFSMHWARTSRQTELERDALGPLLAAFLLQAPSGQIESWAANGSYKNPTKHPT